MVLRRSWLNIVLMLCAANHAAADWLRFRGPNGAGVADSGKPLPEVIGRERNLIWSVKAAAGASSPVVSGNRVFITAYEGDERALICHEAATGKLLWRRTARRVRAQTFHAAHGPATPTPVIEGRRIFALFPDAGLYGYDLDGAELWRADVGGIESVQGLAASPVAVDGVVAVSVDTPGRAFVAAFDARTGKQRWRAERPTGVLGGYATPTVWNGQIIVAGARELTAYQATTGERLWWGSRLTGYPIAPPFVVGDSLFTLEPAGVGWPPFSEPLRLFDKDGDGSVSLAESAADHSWVESLRGIDMHSGNGDGVVTSDEYKAGTSGDDGGTHRLRLGGKGEVSRTHVSWRYTRGIPSLAGALLYNGVLYTIRNGIVATLDPATGARLGEARLPDAPGDYYASPVGGDGKIFFVSHDAVVTVIEAGPVAWRVRGRGELGEPAVATPAISDGRIFVRTQGTMYCFGLK